MGGKAVRRADLSSPKSQKAAAAANAEITRKYGVKAINPSSPNAAAMRKAWMDAYAKNGGALKTSETAHEVQVAKDIDKKATTRVLGEVVSPCRKKATEELLNKIKPCDVALLRVGAWTKKETLGDFTAAECLSLQPLPEAAPEWIRGDLGNSDLVIEAVSTCFIAPDKGNIPPDVDAEVLQVVIGTQWKGTCPDGRHPLVIVHPQADTDPDLNRTSRSSQELKLEVRPPMPDFWSRNFGWASFPKRNPMLVDISATSCGISFDSTPRHELTALLRVYPKDDWKISLKLPLIEPIEGTGPPDDGYKPKKERQDYLTVTRNGAKIVASRVVEDIVHLIQSAKTALHKLKKLLHVVPQEGWIVNIDIRFLEGEISYSRGCKVSKELRGERYVAVESFANLGVSMKLIDASVEIAFGFQLKVENVVDWFKTKNILEVVLKIAGRVECKAEIEYKQTLEGDDEKEVGIKYIPGARRLYVQGVIGVLCIKLDASAGVKTDWFTFAGKAVWGHSKPFTASMTVTYSAAKLYGYVYVDLGIWDYSPHFEVDIWPDIPLYDGPFPPCAEGVPAWVTGVTDGDVTEKGE